MGKGHTVWGRLLKCLLLPGAVAAVVLFFSTALEALEGGQAEEGLRQLENAVRKGCVACYAAEGAYPPSLEYLEEHYGIQVDRERYAVIYSAYAENLMPDITVIENAAEDGAP